MIMTTAIPFGAIPYLVDISFEKSGVALSFLYRRCCPVSRFRITTSLCLGSRYVSVTKRCSTFRLNILCILLRSPGFVCVICLFFVLVQSGITIWLACSIITSIQSEKCCSNPPIGDNVRFNECHNFFLKWRHPN
jgi:hypothetical protein